MYDIEQLRQDVFPSSDAFIYLNHAGISPLPLPTQQKVQWVIEQLAYQPVDFWIEHGMPMDETFRRELAAFINAESESEIVPITTTGIGLNHIAQAIIWQAGDQVLFCDVEFPANANPWFSLRRDGVTVDCITAVDGGLTVESLADAVTDRTRLVAVSAVQFFTGHRTDLAAIGAFCHERNILFVVDGIQAIGHMVFDVQAMHIDVLATGGQKSLLSLPGTGFMYVRQAVAEAMSPRVIGGNATQDYLHWLDYDLTLLPGASRFNSGTPNLPGMFATLTSLRLLRSLGVSHIDTHTSHLVDVAAAKLKERGYEVITPAQHGPIVTFRTGFDNERTDALVMALRERKVAVVKHLDGVGVPHIRLSFHCYNMVAQVEQFLAIWDALVP